MSFIILPKNTAKTAVLVEQNQDIVIDSTTPVSVTVDNQLEEPLAVEQVQNFNTDSVTVLNEISRKLSILIEYESFLHKIKLEETL